MKRVIVTKEKKEVVSLNRVDEDKLYAGKTDADGIIVVITPSGYCNKFTVTSCNGFTYGNGYGNREGYEDLKDAFLDYITWYEFDTFKEMCAWVASQQ